MCCGSHGVMQANELLEQEAQKGNSAGVREAQAKVREAQQAKMYPERTGDVFEEDPAMRCQCDGYRPKDYNENQVTPDGMTPMECKCAFRITGEDMRCNRCRRFCDLDATPRIMSAHARAAVARA